MKIFIAGTKSITTLDDYIQSKLISIHDKGYDVLVGDCNGVDSSVQRFFANLAYSNVTVYASNGRARNNLGHWQVKKVSTPSYLRGFDFYRQKDIAMADDAEYGFMIWDCKSKGTWQNITTLASQNKHVLVYVPSTRKSTVVKNMEDVAKLVQPQAESTAAYQ